MTATQGRLKGGPRFSGPPFFLRFYREITVNTFALILFGFALYLAVNGKLTDYTALAGAQSKP